jgi:hypothetical protein
MAPSPLPDRRNFAQYENLSLFTPNPVRFEQIQRVGKLSPLPELFERFYRQISQEFATIGASLALLSRL